MFATLDSPIGQLALGSDGTSITHIWFPRETPQGEPGQCKVLDAAAEQLRAYFTGTLTEFDLPLAPAGTPWQLSVWQELQTIPYGRTCSYVDIARGLGRPTSSRAVGTANSQNPIPIVVPCHRVIAASGALSGYAGGVDIKRFLLMLEGVELG